MVYLDVVVVVVDDDDNNDVFSNCRRSLCEFHCNGRQSTNTKRNTLQT
jgi:hypothetical protein